MDAKSKSKKSSERSQFSLTAKVHELLIGAKRIGGMTEVLSVVCLVLNVDAETERQAMVALVVGLDAVLDGARDPSPVLRPVDDRLWKGDDLAF